MKNKKLLLVIAFVFICIVAVYMIIAFSSHGQPDQNQSTKTTDADTEDILTEENDLEFMPNINNEPDSNTTQNNSSADTTENTEAPTSSATEDIKQDGTVEDGVLEETTSDDRVELPFVPAQ